MRRGLRWASTTPLIFTLVAICSLILSGCSRTEHRIQADCDAYNAIAERNGDPRWSAAKYDIELDPRSRYYDIYDPDRPPLPPDDPASHVYMHHVDGLDGWGHWHDDGDRPDLENPSWREALGDYTQLTEDSAVKLDVDSALRLAYVHSPAHQQQLETLYLSALDVSEERFRLDTQFFGGSDTVYNHNGHLIPANLTYDPVAEKFVVSPPRKGLDNNRLNVGTDAQVRRRFATAGELLVGFANSFVFEFTGGDTNLASSLANFSFIQPLLRGAGRDIALEQLTFDERKLLANLRAYGQYRQGFYTQVVIGELGVTGPQRGGPSTSLQSFSGAGGVGGYLGLLQQLQQIRNSEDNLTLQLRTIERLEALYDNELVGIVQVDQFRQSIETQRNDVLLRTNAQELALDNYKTETLGLPATLPTELDQTLIEQFQLFPRQANEVLNSLLELQIRIGDTGELEDLLTRIPTLQQEVDQLQANNNLEEVDATLIKILSVIEAVGRRSDKLQADISPRSHAKEGTDEPNGSAVPSGADVPPLPELTDADQALVDFVKQQLAERAEKSEDHFNAAGEKLEGISDKLTGETRAALLNANVAWLKEMLRLSRGCLLIQARARRLDVEPRNVLDRAQSFVEPVQKLLETAADELERMEKIVPIREATMNEDEKERFAKDRQRLHDRLVDLEKGEVGYQVALTRLKAIQDEVETATRGKTLRGMAAWVQLYLQIVERLQLVPAQARLERITVEGVELEADEAFEIALTNRLDFMNGRAALVDRWRRIQVASDALQSVLNLTASGNVRTGKNNPLNFRSPTSRLRMGIEFDAPFTRLLERNAYRESLIVYQQNRRSFIQSRDGLQKGVRALLRNLEQRRKQLEIQRVAVAIAMRRVDQTQLDLNTPPPQTAPGVRVTISPTTAFNLLSAQQALQSTQNAFLSAWLNYYASRLRLYRELGIMDLDSDGRWIEQAIKRLEDSNESDEQGEPLEVPPPVPPPLLEAAIEREKQEAQSVIRKRGSARSESRQEIRTRPEGKPKLLTSFATGGFGIRDSNQTLVSTKPKSTTVPASLPRSASAKRPRIGKSP